MSLLCILYTYDHNTSTSQMDGRTDGRLAMVNTGICYALRAASRAVPY